MVRGIYLLERINFFFRIHFKRHIVLYGIVIFVFLIGITSGAFTVNAISPNQIGGLAEYIENFINSTGSGTDIDVDKVAILLEGLRQYCGFAFIVWFLGLSYVGIPMIVIAFGLKGFLLGFTTGFIVSSYGARGFLFILMCILPQNLIYIPCITIIVIIALENAMSSYKQRKSPVSRQYRNKNFTSYTIKILMVTIVLMIGILYETFIAPLFLNIFSSIFKR